MAEETKNDPLTGEEIIIAVCDKLAEHLRLDCFLHPDSAYRAFSGTITVNICANDVGQDFNISQIVKHEVGTTTDDGLQAQVDVITIDEQPPDQVRVETGQPVPHMVKDERGRPEQKKISYARDKAKKKSS